MRLSHWCVLATAALFLLAPRTTSQAASPALPSLLDGSEVLSEVPDEYAAGDQVFCPPTTGAPLDIRVPNLCPGFQFHAGLLFLKPSADNLGYAVLTTEKNYASPVPLATPYWDIETLTPSFQPGLEVGTGYTFANSGKDVRVNWQHLRTSDSDAAAVTQSDGQWISPFSQTGPPTADSYDQINEHAGVNKLLSADGKVNFSYDTVNLDFGQYVNVGSSLAFRLFAGLGYARLQERLVSSFFGAPPAADAVFPESVPLVLSLNNTSTFSGVGPRLGLDTTYAVPGGLRLTGQLAGALLIGRTQPAQYLFTATAPELAAVGIAVNQERIGSPSYNHVVYAADARLGIGYMRVLPNRSVFTVEAGYLAAIYVKPFSGYETNDNILALQIGSLSTASMRHTLSDFTANGFYLNVGLKW